LVVIGDFLRLSLFSLGGGNTLLNEYHHMAVDQYCWLSSRQFAEIYAIAEAAPGPSSMIVGLLGMGAAVKEGPLWGVLSGVMAEISILLPSTC
jgi:chromate transporter